VNFSTVFWVWNTNCRAISQLNLEICANVWAPLSFPPALAASAPRFTSSTVAIHEVYRPAAHGAQRYPMTTPVAAVAGVKVVRPSVCSSIRCAVAFLTCRVVAKTLVKKIEAIWPHNTTLWHSPDFKQAGYFIYSTLLTIVY